MASLYRKAPEEAVQQISMASEAPVPSNGSRTTPELPLSTSRSRRQLGLFFAGATFFVLSTMITRRSLVRRYNAMRPAFYQPNTRTAPVNGALEAFEALNLATINVVSFSMMAAGGTLWAFDIQSLEDMRRKIRGGSGIDGTGRTERDAEEEFEEWIASVLARKDEKEKRRKESTQGGGTNERGDSR